MTDWQETVKGGPLGLPTRMRRKDLAGSYLPIAEIFSTTSPTAGQLLLDPRFDRYHRGSTTRLAVVAVSLDERPRRSVTGHAS